MHACLMEEVQSTDLPTLRSVCAFQHFYVTQFDIIPYHMITVKYILVDGVRLEPSRSMGLKSLRDLLRETTHARENRSVQSHFILMKQSYIPIPMQIMRQCIHMQFRKLTLLRQCIHMQLRKLTMSFFETKDFSCMRFLAIWVSVITCIIVTFYGKLSFHSHSIPENISSVLFRH